MNFTTISLSTFIAFVVGFLGGFLFNGYRLESKYTAEKLAIEQQVREKEKTWQDINENLQETLRKESEYAEKTIADLRSRVADGRVRFTARVRNCTSAPAESQEARAELDSKVADDLLSITEDGDNAIRELNYCIDAYESLRK